MTVNAAVLQVGERLAVATDTAKHEVQFAQVRRRFRQHLVTIVSDTKKRSETPEVVIALAAAASDVTSPTAFWELVEQYFPDHQVTGDEAEFVSNLFALPAFMEKIEAGLHALARETVTSAAATADAVLQLRTMSVIARNTITATPDHESQMIQRLQELSDSVDEAIAQQDQAAIDGYAQRVEQLARKMNRR